MSLACSNYLSSADIEVLLAVSASSNISVFVPLPVTLSSVDHLKSLVLPPQLLQASLHFLDLMLQGPVLSHQLLFVLLFTHTPAGIQW